PQAVTLPNTVKPLGSTQLRHSPAKPVVMQQHPPANVIGSVRLGGSAGRGSSMSRRQFIVSLGVTGVVWPLAAQGQQMPDTKSRFCIFGLQSGGSSSY